MMPKAGFVRMHSRLFSFIQMAYHSAYVNHTQSILPA